MEIVNINTNDGESAKPIAVTQRNLVVPEGNATAIQLQTVAASPLDDTDGDGIVDILDNSPLVVILINLIVMVMVLVMFPMMLITMGFGILLIIVLILPTVLLVDNSGCLIFYLPPSNFSISKTEKCRDTNSISLVGSRRLTNLSNSDQRCG